ncbi:filamentous hemagglutinin N-terminal domain-containing protein [Noviherbaspirillum sp. ST9]|uniref:two-partner secretion domain-containing protein n=1 Tax=Noviherbaspirillum sp. ST9 TaxID=3401606 RepID=UPI003B587BF7
MNINPVVRNQRTPKCRSVLHRRLLSILVGGCFGTAFANPVSPQVINGQASFLNQGNVLSVTNTPGTIINWQGFSISQGELTRFIQQNANSAVLNRITGQDPSQILGALQSNGRVFIVNPNGILFGQGAQVDVNGLMASTLNISNEDFLIGKMLFKAGDKAANLKNEGSITTPAGGQVFLIAPNVENSGIITSPKGEVMLAAGHMVQLADSLNPELRVVLSAPENEALNLGQVISSGGKASIYGALIRQRGIVNADSAVVGENGKVVLKASRDTLLEAGSRTTAKGAGKGGEIHVLGERVGLTGDAMVDASGQQGGGIVLVGGDYQGKNPDVQNAKVAYVGKDVQVKADAVENGDGGKVIVWADDTARYYGSISARGGRHSGNGGLVETSGKQHLAFNGKVDVDAPNGKAGSLLLDPQDIIIANGSGGANDGLLSDSQILVAEPDTVTDVTISEQALEALSGSVTLNASRDIILQNISDDTVNLASVAGGSTFTISAGRHIIGTADVNDRFQTGGGNVVFTTTSGNLNIGGVKSKGGAISMTAGGTGFMVVREANSTPLSGNGGNISLTSSGLMTLDTINASGVTGTTGDVSLTAGGDISVGNSALITANHLKMTTTGGIHGAATSDYANIKANFLNAKSTVSGPIRLSNTGSNLIVYDGGVAGANGIHAANGLIDLKNGVGGEISVQAPIITSAAPIALAAPLGIELIAYDSGTNAGGLISSNGGAISLTVSGGGSIDVQTNAKIASGGGLVTLTSDWIDLAGGLVDAGSANVQLKPFNPAETIQVGGTGGEDGYLALNQNDLAAVKTSGTLKIGDTLSAPSGFVNVSGTLDLVTPGKLTGPFEIYTATGTVSISAAMTVPKDLYISSESGSIAINAPGAITAGSLNNLLLKTAALNVNGSLAADDVELSTDSLTLGASASITSSVTGIYPKTAGNSIMVGAACTGPNCLSITNLYKIDSPAIGIGNTSAPIPGDITVAGITNTGSSALTDRHANTTRIGLMTGGNVTQTGPIDVNTLGVKAAGSVNLATSTNHVTELAGLSGGAFAFKNDQSFSIADISGSGPTYDYSFSGLVTSNSSITLTLAGVSSSVLDLDAAVNAGTGTVTIDSSGSVFGSAFSPDIVAGNVSIKADGSSGIDGAGGLHITAPLISKLETAAGSVNVLGFSALTIGATTPTAMTAVSAPAGSVTITTSSSLPLTINGDVSAGGNINLTAGSAGSSFSGNVLTINRPVTSTSGTITLGANSVGGTSVPTGAILQLPSSGGGGGSTEPPPPTLEQCTTSPTLSGCSTVLPTLDACIAAPSTAGCSAVLPTVDACAANPTLAGCSVVSKPPPSIDTCIAAPTTAGCNTVLPTFELCTSAPSTPGCTVVLPPFDVCVQSPSIAGCNAVLPPVGVCTANPAQPGCNVVLPPLITCIATPNVAGCSAVLPSMSICTTAPTTAGCTAVLPTLAQCSANPSQEGCSVVVPTASKCVTNPSAPECQTVLPTTGTEQGPATTITELVVETTNTVVITQASVIKMQPGSGGSSGGSSPQSDSDSKKEEKKTLSSTDDSGVKKNEPAKKMYCN